MSMETFKKIGDWLGRNPKLKQVKVQVGEPYKGEKLYLVYDKKSRDFTLEWEDGVKLSDKIKRKTLPQAMAILSSVYMAERKKLQK